MPMKIGHPAADEFDQWLLHHMELDRKSLSGGFTGGDKGTAWMEVLHQLAKEVIPSAPKVKEGFSRKYAVEAVTWGVDPERIKAAYLLIFG